MSKIISEQTKQEIINYYLSEPMTLAQVSEKFNLCKPTVGKILSEIPKYTKAQLNNPYLKERFFETIDSEEKAYFLGLIIADGNVYKEPNSGRQHSISITLDENDKYLLEKFKEVLNANTAISQDGRGCNQFAVRSDLMAEDLKKYGVVERKSLITYLPQIDDNYMNHLIRGIFDGDGSIASKLNEKTNKHRHSFCFCGSHKLMEDISNYCKKLNLETIPKVYDYKDGKNLSDIKIANIHDMLIFGEWIYRDASIYMLRKKERYDNFKQYYNL